jgi:hypothetical protein
MLTASDVLHLKREAVSCHLELCQLLSLTASEEELGYPKRIICFMSLLLLLLLPVLLVLVLRYRYAV